VPVHVWNYSISPTSASVCPGQSINAGILFNVAPTNGQYTYSWSPTTWLFNQNGSLQNTVISPTAPAVGVNGTETITIIVTPAIANCPITKIMTITAVSPPIPTITALPALCTNMLPLTIQVFPTGGVFSTTLTGNPINPNTGILTPSLVTSLAPNNTFTYTVTDYTCTARSQGIIDMSKFNTAALTTPTMTPLCVTNPQVNLMNMVQSTIQGTWTSQNAPGALQGAPGAQFFNPATLNTGTYLLTYTTTSSPNKTACPASSTINVAVTKTITPVIIPPIPICNNAVPFSMTVSPSGGSWSGQGISSQGLVTPSLYGQAGNFSVNYQVNIGPCVNTATSVLQVSQYNTAAFSGPIPSLCEQGNPFNLMSVVQNTLGTWNPIAASSNWTATAVSNNSFVPSGLPTGTYMLTYANASTPIANLGCDESKTISVSVLNPAIPVITAIQPMCSKASAIQLSVSPATGSWTPSSYVDANGVFTPSMASIGNNAITYVIGTPTCNNSRSKMISIEAFVPADIVVPIPDQCNTGVSINLTPFTISGAGIWSGSGISGTSFNPGLAGAGSFVLMHKTASSPSGLCPDQHTIAVNVYSLAAPAVTKLDPVCNSHQPIQLEVSPVGGLFGGLNTTAISLKGVFIPQAQCLATTL